MSDMREMVKSTLGNIWVVASFILLWFGHVLLLNSTALLRVGAWGAFAMSISMLVLLMVPRDNVPAFRLKHRAAVFFALAILMVVFFPEHLSKK